MDYTIAHYIARSVNDERRLDITLIHSVETMYI